MDTFVFRGMAVVVGVEILVEADTLGEAVGILARQESVSVNVETGTVDYFWADLNSGVEKPQPTTGTE